MWAVSLSLLEDMGEGWRVDGDESILADRQDYALGFA